MTGASIETEELDEYRRLVALLCDESREALHLLGRVLPQPLVTRHLVSREAVVAPPDTASLLAALSAQVPRPPPSNNPSPNHHCDPVPSPTSNPNSSSDPVPSPNPNPNSVL